MSGFTERKIDGTSYRIDTPPARESLALMLDAGRIVGPGLDPLLAAYAGGAGMGAFAKAAMAILSENDDTPAIMAFLDRFLALGEIKRPSGDWDALDLDSCPPADLFEVVGMIAEAAWSGFFAKAIAKAKAGAEAKAKKAAQKKT